MLELYSMTSEWAHTIDTLTDLASLEKYADANQLQIVTPEGFSDNSQFEAVLHQLLHHVYIFRLRLDGFKFVS